MKKKNLFIVPCTALALVGSGYVGYELGKNSSSNTTESLIKNITETKKIAYADKISDIVVTDIFEDGYTTLHGDHSHFEKGLVPFNAKFLDKLIYKNSNYTLRSEDIQYEVAQGYIIKIDGKFYYYPKDGVQQSNIVDEATAKIISASSNHHSHHPSTNEDNYSFNPKDVVSETADGYVVRHGDHYHYIKKSELNASQLAQVQENGISAEKISNVAGIDYATSDGYIFKGESDIIGKNNFGFIVKHGTHEHIIPYESLRGTKWNYLIEDTPYSAKSIKTHPRDSVENNDNYHFNPKDIIAEDEEGYTVRHNDHYHYIPKKKTNNSTSSSSINNSSTSPKNNDDASANNHKENNTSSKEIEEKLSYLAKILNIDKNLIKVIHTDKGEALVYPHGDHYHTVFLNEIHISDNSNLVNDEIEKQISYIADIYGVPREAIRVTSDFFIFNEPTQEYDPTHIHPYLIPRNKFRIPTTTGDKEVDFEDELHALAERTGIDPDAITIEEDKFVIPHGSHNHYVKIKSGGAAIYLKNKIPNIIGSYVAGDLDKETVLTKIDMLIADNTKLHKDTKVVNRINRALNQLKSSITTLPTNSTVGYLTMLENFDKKYIHIDNSVNSDDEEFIKIYNSLLSRVKNSNIEHLGLEKESLITELNNASTNHNKDVFEKITHLLDEVEKFDNQTGPTTLSYVKYFLENINSDKIDNKLREELAYLIKYSYLGEAQIIDSHAEELIVRLINAKNKLHYQLSQNVKNEVIFGDNYAKLNEKYYEDDSCSIFDSAKNFVGELDGFLPNLDFSKSTNKDELTSSFIKKDVADNNIEKFEDEESSDSYTNNEEVYADEKLDENFEDKEINTNNAEIDNSNITEHFKNDTHSTSANVTEDNDKTKLSNN